MNNNQYYVRLTNTVSDFGKLIPLEDFQNKSKLQSYISTNPKSDWYSSLFRFPQQAKDYFDQHQSIAGYMGPAVTSRLVFDFDSKIDQSVAKDDTIKLLQYFVDQSIDVNSSVKVFFSGSKGFHLELFCGRL